MIHITRDPHSVYQYLDSVEDSKVQDILTLSTPVYRRCSNYEFYNLSETSPTHLSVVPAHQTSVPAFFDAQESRKDFLQVSIIDPISQTDS